MNRRHFLKATGLAGSASLLAVEADAQGSPAGRVELRRATVVVGSGDLPNAERTAAAMLVDEITHRCGLRLRISTNWPAGGPVIVVAPHPDDETLGCGATIMQKLAAGTPVHVVIATDGRYWPRFTKFSTDILVKIREEEAC